MLIFLLVVMGRANQRHDFCQTIQIEWLLSFSLLFFHCYFPVLLLLLLFFSSPNANREQIKTHRLKIVIWYWFFFSRRFSLSLSFIRLVSIHTGFIFITLDNISCFFFLFFRQHSMCARVLCLVLSLSVARFYFIFHRFDN